MPRKGNLKLYKKDNTMAKSIFEEIDGTYEMQGDYRIPYLTNRKGTADRLIREAAFAVLKGTSQDYLH